MTGHDPEQLLDALGAGPFDSETQLLALPAVRAVYAAFDTAPAVVPRGVVLGSVVLVDVVDDDSTSPWAVPGQKHWLLTDPDPWPEPLPAKGDLGLWDWPRD